MPWFRKRTEDRALQPVDTYGNGMLSTYLPSSSPTPDAAMRIADVYSCIRCLSDAAASVPLILYRRRTAGRERVTSGRTVELLDKPAPAVTQANLVGQTVAHLNAHGNAFLGKYKDPDGQVEQLGLLDPCRVQVALKAGQPRYTLTNPQGLTTEHGTDDILHIRALSTDGLVGLSPIRQCAVAMRVADAAGLFVDSYLAQGFRPAGFISIGHDATPDQVEYLKESLRARHDGASRMHKVGIFGGADMKWILVTLTLGDLEFVEQRKLSTAEIARIFRVPGRMLNAPTADPQTYANVESVMLEFVTYSLRPWLVLIEQAITNDPDLCRGPKTYVEFLLDGLLRADHATRADVYTKALDPITGWMTREEVRGLENLPAETTPTVAAAATNGATAHA